MEDFTAIRRILGGTGPDIAKYVALTDWLWLAMETFIEGSQPAVAVRRVPAAIAVEVNGFIPREKMEAIRLMSWNAVQLRRLH